MTFVSDICYDFLSYIALTGMVRPLVIWKYSLSIATKQTLSSFATIEPLKKRNQNNEGNTGHYKILNVAVSAMCFLSILLLYQHKIQAKGNAEALKFLF